MLILAQLFVIPAAAITLSASELGQINTAMNEATAEPSGAQEGSAAAENAEREAQEREAEEAAAAAEAAREAARASTKIDYEIAPVTQFGTAEDVMIGGLRITPGVWYTVDSEGVLTSAEAWPRSYLFYSASQSKLTLHEFHYKVPTDTIGKESTYAALYLPKDMHIVLEGENELINTSYTTAGGGVSNGVYAPDHHISFEGNGTLYVNTRSSDGFKGYGIQAGSIRIDSEFTGLAVFGMTSAFSCAPSVAEGKGLPIDTSLFAGYNDYVKAYKDIEAFGSKYGLDVGELLYSLGSVPSAPQGREMLANVADLHPQYHEGVHVREASPYDQSIFTRFRYVLFVVGGDISWEKEMRAKVEAEYYRNKMEYNLGVEQGYAEAFDSFTTEVSNGLFDIGVAMDQEINDINNFGNTMNQELGDINSQGYTIDFENYWNNNIANSQSSGDDINIGDYWDENLAGLELAQMLMGGN